MQKIIIMALCSMFNTYWTNVVFTESFYHRKCNPTQVCYFLFSRYKRNLQQFLRISYYEPRISSMSRLLTTRPGSPWAVFILSDETPCYFGMPSSVTFDLQGVKTVKSQDNWKLETSFAAVLTTEVWPLCIMHNGHWSISFVLIIPSGLIYRGSLLRSSLGCRFFWVAFL